MMKIKNRNTGKTYDCITQAVDINSMESMYSDTTLGLKITNVLIAFIAYMIMTLLTKCMKSLANKFDIEQKVRLYNDS